MAVCLVGEVLFSETKSESNIGRAHTDRTRLKTATFHFAFHFDWHGGVTFENKLNAEQFSFLAKWKSGRESGSGTYSSMAFFVIITCCDRIVKQKERRTKTNFRSCVRKRIQITGSKLVGIIIDADVLTIWSTKNAQEIRISFILKSFYSCSCWLSNSKIYTAPVVQPGSAPYSKSCIFHHHRVMGWSLNAQKIKTTGLVKALINELLFNWRGRSAKGWRCWKWNKPFFGLCEAV